MNRSDQLGGLVWLAISVCVCVVSFQSDLGTFHIPGAGFVPFWLGVILGAFAIVLIFTSSVKGKSKATRRDLWKGVKWDKDIAFIGSLIIYLIILSKLGYLISTFGLMIFLFGIIGRSKLWVRVLSALVTVLATYVIFYVCLEVQLPRGIFSF